MKELFQLTLLVSALTLLVSCGEQSSPKPKVEPPVEPPKIDINVLKKITNSSEKLNYILENQSDKHKQRQKARNPKETIDFFGIKPGMTVSEVYPGWGCWYTQVLLSYLGSNGELVAADYAVDMFPKFGFFDDHFVEGKKLWVKNFPERFKSWGVEGRAKINALQLGSMPKSIEGSLDAMLYIRALHNLVRFESDGNYLSIALEESYRALKPGGILGIVQHMAPENISDEWAGGQNGYLKKSFVIKTLEEAGFEYIGSSDININTKDQPTEQDNVWRLPPTLKSSKDNEELKKKYMAIGESTRMTLKFRKPAK
jgi:predicted methyltransferase